MGLMRNRVKTYVTRVRGLQKKIYEFSTLVNVDACMIVYGSKQGQTDMYPENLGDVIRIVKRYLSLPKQERIKRHIQLSSGDDDGTEKKIENDDNSDELVSMTQDNNNNNNNEDGLEEYLEDRFDKLSADQIQQLIYSVESKIESIDEKIQFIEDAENLSSSRISDHGAATTTVPRGGNTFMQMQPIYVLQPFNQNLANNGSTMPPMGMMMNDAYPTVMQYHQGQVTYLVPHAFVQPMSYIPNLMPGGTPSDA